MKKTIGNLTVRIGADTKQFTNAMNRTKRQTKGMSAQFSKLGNVMMGAFSIYAVGSIVKNAIKTNIEFEKAMADVQAITKATQPEFEALTANAKKLGASTEHTASAVASLQKEYGKLGFTTQEILDATAATLDLATATGEDLAISAETTGATIRGFGLDAKETGRVVDLMAASFTSSALDLNRFGESMKYVAPIARAAGVDIETVTAMLSLLADAGIHGSMAGTALKKILSELSVPGKTMQEVFSDLAKEGIGLAEAEKLVGDRAKAGLLVLTSNVDKLDDLTESYNNAGGAAKDMADIQRNTVSGSLAKLSSAWEGLILTLQNGKGALKDGIDFLTELVSSVKWIIDQDPSTWDFMASLIGINLPKERWKEHNKEMKDAVKIAGELNKVISERSAKTGIKDTDLLSGLRPNQVPAMLGIDEASYSLDVYAMAIKEVEDSWARVSDEIGDGKTIIPDELLEQTNTWTESLDDLEQQIKDNNAAIQKSLSLDEANMLREENAALEEQIRLRKIQMGLTPTHGKMELNKLTPVASEGVTANPEFLDKITSPTTLSAVKGLTNGVKELGDGLADVGEVAIDISGMVANAMVAMADVIGNAIGEMMNGTADGGTILKSIIGIIAQFLRALGSAMITAGMASIAFKNLMSSGWGAVAAGAALIATSAVVTALMSNTPALAAGGLAYGPTLAMVGDNAGARSDPEVIAPLSKLGGMMNGGVNVEVTGKVRGTDLYLVMEKYNNRRDQYS